MADLFTTSFSDGPVRPPAAPEPIRPAQTPLTAPQAAPPADAEVIRAFVNDERNSRLARPVGDQGTWHVRWKTELPRTLRPSELCTAGDRIVLRGGGLWQLYGANGPELALKPLGKSPVTLDPRHGLLFAADNSGQLVAYRLKDGERAFSLMVGSVGRFEPIFVARRDHRLITTSKLRDTHPDGPPPEKTMIEVVNLGDAPKSWNQPGGAHPVKDLVRESYRLLTALNGDVITLATEDRVYLLDADLQIRQALAGSFIPFEMSLDEAGRIYLLVQAEGRTALWLLSPRGERWYSFVFPPGVGDVVRPPIVAYDHTAYIVTGERILSVAPDGKLNWMRSAAGSIAGAAISADDVLLTAEGNALTAWDAQGQRRVLYEFVGEALATAPALTSDGDLLVATRTALYRLSRAKP